MIHFEIEPRTAIDFNSGVFLASRSILLELCQLLNSYKENMVLIGGWAPYLLLERYGKPNSDPHIGTIDIDLAVHPRIAFIKDRSIANILRENGYTAWKDPDLGDLLQFRNQKVLKSPYDNKEYVVVVDFLTQLEGAPVDRVQVPIQPNLFAMKSKGCRLAFEHSFLMEINGKLPNGEETSIQCRVADLVGSIMTKSFALKGREGFKEKDAYDIHHLISNYKEGPFSAAKEVVPVLKDPLVAEAIEILKEMFGHIRAPGCAMAATFLAPTDSELRNRIIANTFKDMEQFFKHGSF